MKPSVKTLKRYWQPEVALKARELMDGRLDPETFESVEGWIRQSYHRPSDDELVMEALNKLLEGHGVEAVWPTDVVTQPRFEYINMGDTYDATIVHDLTTGHYHATTWGDYFELLEHKGVMFP